MNKATNCPDRFINITEVCQMFGISRTTVYRDIQAGVLPQPMKIGRRSRWSQNELEKIQEQIKNKTAA
ncbi:helix-turn-helix transcriptional regulator [Maridesulfovibrio hydrothermalis]|uniref:Helix-turn-helix domain-containing protein n=1 Tax=Maridesulfovibrio hydrothermalis AM13 = DSM 14728 TaxID=1121451 RepID=L0RB77_9BACT|nr:helix-turn-helix domain-containing protein [Maridesulfovibrio hydrothermalis]CCO24004.1 protein of unknown function [Maridesulfovibrio hydrothermalis AM13 = DSM 14728]